MHRIVHRLGIVRVLLFWLLSAGGILGCAWQPQQSVSTPGMPEEIYTAPPGIDVEQPRICVQAFSSPAAAPGMGRFAAVLLRRALSQRGIPAECRAWAAMEGRGPDPGGSAGENPCDQVVAGDLLYYFEGGRQLPARVEQQVRIVDVRQPFVRILWEARAVEISEPIPPSDWIFVQGTGAPAVPAAELMRRNAEKFANMITATAPDAVDGGPK